MSQPNHWVGDPETNDYLTFVNAQLPAGESSFVYAFGGWSFRDATAPGFYRRTLQFTQTWPQIYPIGFLPLIQTSVTDGSGTLGVRGTRSEWYWDLSLQYGRNAMDFNIENTLNASLGPGIPPNKTEFYAGTFVADQLLANLDLSREIEVGLAGPLNVAFGSEYRREGYQLQAGEPDSYRDGGIPASNGARAVPGAQVFPGFRPSNAADTSRSNVALYLDLEGDVARPLRLGLAGRFEHYSDFGSHVDGKLTVRLQAHERFIIRAAASTGFRAPSLAQSNFSAVSTNFLNIPGQGTVPVEVGTFAVTSPVARALGATELKPEESVHLTAGFAFNAEPQLRPQRGLLRHRDRRPHRVLRQLHGGRDQRDPGPVRRDGGALLHQRDQHAHQRRGPDRQLPPEPGRRQRPALLRRLQLQPHADRR